jgi:hypothetical protein
LYERFLTHHKKSLILTGIKITISTTCFQKFRNFSAIQNTALFNPTQKADFVTLSSNFLIQRDGFFMLGFFMITKTLSI